MSDAEQLRATAIEIAERDVAAFECTAKAMQARAAELAWVARELYEELIKLRRRVVALRGGR